MADAIAEAGHSPTLRGRLATAEADLARLEREIAAHKPVDVAADVEEIQDFFTKHVMQLRSPLWRDRPAARLRS